MTVLSIIVASSGRSTLARTIESGRSQMQPGDEILVSINLDCPWGHAARNQLMPAARGDALMFIDDDDVYAEGALDVVRAAVAEAPDRMHMFRMRYTSGQELWQRQDVVCGNVSTQMVVVPRAASHLGGWAESYEGDYHFIASTCRAIGDPVWHQDVIALVRPA